MASQLPPHLNPRGSGRSSSATTSRVPGNHPRFRGLKILAVVASALVLLGSGVAYGLYRHYDSQITRLHDVLGGGGKKTTNGAENILIVGSDSRSGSNADFQAGKGQTLVEGQRSDTIIFAHLGKGGAKAVLVSLPRDSWVTIPAYTDSKGKQHPEHQDKINAALSLGGPKLLVQTVQELSGLHVDHYVEIDFNGFQNMVNALGGVDVCLTKAAKDKMSGVNLPKGWSHLDGAQALGFVRQRYNLTNGDLDRIKRQQQLLGAVVRKTISAGTLLNPVKLNDFLNAVTRSVSVDSSLDVKDLALRMRNVQAGNVVFLTLPFSHFEKINGQEVNRIDDVRTAALFASLHEGSELPDTTPKGPVLTIPPDKITIDVRNGGGKDGEGRRTAEALKKLGYLVPEAASNADAPAKQSEVRYAPDQLEAARTVAAAVAGSTLVEDTQLTKGQIQLVIGANFTGVKEVAMGDAAPVPSGTPNSQQSPGVPQGRTAEDASCTS
jgi:LCP family protein required for cell wall assembly